MYVVCYWFLILLTITGVWMKIFPLYEYVASGLKSDSPSYIDDEVPTDSLI